MGSLYPPQSFSKTLRNFSEQGRMERLHSALRRDVLSVLYSWWGVFFLLFFFIALEELIATPRCPLTSRFCSGEPRVSPGSPGQEGDLLCSVRESQCWEQGCFCLIFFFSISRTISMQEMFLNSNSSTDPPCFGHLHGCVSMFS